MATYTRNYSSSQTFQLKAVQNGNTLYDTYNVRDFTGSRTGQNMPGWRARIRAGQSATTPYTLDNYTIRKRSAGYAANYGVILPAPPGRPAVTRIQQMYGYSVPLSPFGHLSGTTTSAETIALASLYRKIEQETSRLNGSSFVAEFRDVIHQFKRPFKSLVDLTNNRINLLAKARKGLSGSPAQKKKTYTQIVSDTYLEYVFGLAPLISDTKAIAEAYARFNHEASGGYIPTRDRVTGKGETVVSSSQTTTGQVANCAIVYKTTLKRETTFGCMYTCGLSTSHIAAFGSNDRLLQLLGFTPGSWIPAIWEVVPWSFLVDYFTNIGDILQAMVTSTAGVTWISKSVKTQTFWTSESPVDSALTAARVISDGYTVGSGGGTCGSYTAVRTTLVRTVPTSLGIPTLSLSLPSEDKKWVNMAALLLARQGPSSVTNFG